MKSSEANREHGCSIHSGLAGLFRTIGWCVTLATSLIAVQSALPLSAGEPAASNPVDIRKLKSDPAQPVTGTLFISGGGRLPPAALDRFVDYGGGSNCRLVVITTASETADTPEIEPRISIFRTLKINDLCFLHTRNREEANSEEFCLPLESATAVWFIGGHQSRLTEAYLDTRVERSLKKVLERGGVIGGTSAGAAIMSQVMIKGGNPEPELDRGFGFLPGTLVDQHFLKRHRLDRLLNALSGYPELVGLGIDEGTTLVVQGRTMTVLEESDSQVTTCLVGVNGKPAKTDLLNAGKEVDLIALARAAARRKSPKMIPGKPVNQMGLPSGTVVVCGGGKVPPAAVEKFIEAAGGVDSPIVVITTATGEKAPADEETVEFLKSAGARQVVCLHVTTPAEASSQRVLDLVNDARGVWFTGGRQWRLIDAVEETPLEAALHGLLARDAAIGGSAGGASVLASCLVRGNPVTNRDIVGEGYEDGFGLLAGTAIDGYFSQRNRRSDMAHLKRIHPELLGIGVDESTAVVIRGRELSVHGSYRVSLYNQYEDEQQSEDDYVGLRDGDRFDLVSNKKSRDTKPNDDESGRGAFVASLDEPEDDEDVAPEPPLVCR